MNLLRLYASILVPIFSDSISIIELSFVDASVTNQKLRQMFLNLLQYCKVKLAFHDTLEDYCQYIRKCEWIMNRGLIVSSVCYDQSLNLFQLSLVSKMKSLEYFEGSYLAFCDVLQVCPLIRSFKITEELSDDGGSAVRLATVTGLQSMDISECSDFTSHLYSGLCSDLICFTGHSSFDATILIQHCKSLRCVASTYSHSVINAIVESDHIHSITLTNCGGALLHSDITRIADRFTSDLITLRLMDAETLTDSPLLHVAAVCPGLTSIDFSSGGVSDVTLVALAFHCTSLREVRLKGATISDVGITDLVKRCSASLTYLQLAHCSYLGDTAITAVLSQCYKLVYLDVTYTGITDVAVMDVAAAAPSLETIKIGNQTTQTITNKSLITNIHDLEYLSMEFNMLRINRNRRSFLSLHYSHAMKRPTDYFCTLFQQCPRLIKLKLKFQSHLVDANIECLVSVCPQLTSLELSNCDQLTCDCINSITRSGVPLSALCITEMHDVSERAMTALVSSKSRLRKLELRGCSGLTDGVLGAVAQHCSQLSQIAFTECSCTTEAVILLLRRCPHLCCLAVSSASVGPEVLLAVLHLRRKMYWIDASDCPDIHSWHLEAIPKEFLVSYGC